MNLLYGNPPVTIPQAILKPITIQDIYKLITTDKAIKKHTSLIRSIKDPVEKKRQKRTLLPYILPFEYSKLIRNAKYFKSADCMFFEADHVENLQDVIKVVAREESVALIFVSVSGDGFKFLIKLDSSIDQEYHLRVYNVLRAHYNKKFNIVLDPSSKDMARVQFLGHDPKAYINSKPVPVNVGEIVKRLQIYDDIPITRHRPENELAYSDKDIKRGIKHIRKHGYLDQKDEQLWWELSMAIASLGEAGREYFLLLSSDHPLYPEDTESALNKRYDKFLQLWGNYHDEDRILNMNAFFNKIEKVYGFKAPRTDTTHKKSIEFILADKFTQRYKDLLLYDHSKAGKARTYGWYIWDGKSFKLSLKGEISDYYLAFITEEKHKAIEAAKERKAKEAELGHLEEDTSTQTPVNLNIKELLNLAQVSKAESRRYRDLTLTWAGEREGLGVLPDELDQDKELFNVLNGVLNLRTGRLLDHTPTFRMTKISSIIYQKNAKCPNWEEFIMKISYNNSAIASYIQEAVGYSLTGHTSEQCLFFLYGTGANGKSTFLEGLKLVLGEYQTHANYETFTALNRDGNSHSEDVVRLKGSRLVVSSEINANKSLNESVIKQMTSGDTLTARDLHSSSIEFKPMFKLWIAGNHKPKIQNFDYGIRRRIFIVPFEHKFIGPEVRPQYEVIENFKQESSGILNWALEGARRWFKVKKLTVPQEVVDTTRDYFLENNLIEQFLIERCNTESTISGSAGLVEEAKTLYQAYVQYSDRLNEDRLGRNQFYQRLEELGYKRSCSTLQALIFRGIQLKASVEYDPVEESSGPARSRKSKHLPE